MKTIKNINFLSLLEEISISALNMKNIDFLSNNLLGDKSGVALFLFYMYRLTERDEFNIRAIDLLEDVVHKQEVFEIIPTSVSKYGWLMYHLNKLNFIEANVDESRILLIWG